MQILIGLWTVRSHTNISYWTYSRSQKNDDVFVLFRPVTTACHALCIQSWAHFRPVSIPFCMHVTTCTINVVAPLTVKTRSIKVVWFMVFEAYRCVFCQKRLLRRFSILLLDYQSLSDICLRSSVPTVARSQSSVSGRWRVHCWVHRLRTRSFLQCLYTSAWLSVPVRQR